MGIHDRAFKQLISTFLLDFLDLFFPQVREYLDESSLVFLDKEIFTDLLTGQQREADLVVRANWRDFVRQTNPVASALMARMKIAPKDRPFVKLECLRLLTSLKLDRARMHLISAFVDNYLALTAAEEAVFQSALGEIEPERKEEIMELTTSWMRQGIQQGIQIGEARGQRQEAMNLVTRQLRRRFGAAIVSHEKQLEHLTLTKLEDSRRRARRDPRR